jgi:hypothetical protein
MNDMLVDAEMLARFSNLKPSEVEEFRNRVCRDFLPDDFWRLLSARVGDLPDTPLETWRRMQQSVQDMWAKRFPLEGSIQLITRAGHDSEQAKILARSERKSNEEIAATEQPQVWPFQRAVMYLAVNSWRARFCPACGSRFVALTPKSTYCTEVRIGPEGKKTTCFAESRKGKKKAWWSEHGEHWRASRKEAKNRKNRPAK